jgi:hypothetical protein
MYVATTAAAIGRTYAFHLAVSNFSSNFLLINSEYVHICSDLPSGITFLLQSMVHCSSVL